MAVNQTPCPDPVWGRAARRIPLLGLLFALLGTGCADPVVGGSGTLVRGRDGAPDVLRLAGSPHEMGWWHGKLLGPEIKRLHARWKQTVFRDVIGMTHDLDTGAAGDLKDQMLGFLDTAIENEGLPETIRQELAGMSASTGIPVAELFFLELMRDGVRIRVRSLEPRLPGGLAAWQEGPVAAAWWAGADAALLDAHLLVIERRPDEGVATVVAAWPGALGGVAGLAGNRRAYLSAEAEVDGEFRGFGNGTPFTVAARAALEAKGDTDRMRALMRGTAGHAVLVMQDPEDEESGGVVASVEIYRGVQPAIDVAELGYLVLGSDQRVRAGLAKAGLARRPEDTDGLRARVFAAARKRAAASKTVYPSVRIDWQAEGGIAFEVRRGEAAGATRLVLGSDGRFGAPVFGPRTRD